MTYNYLLEVTWTDKWQVYIGAATLVTTFLIVIITGRWTMMYWRKQKKEEFNYQLQSLRYQSMFEAAKAAWSLLAFLSEKENGDNFLIYRGTKENPEVFFDLDRGRRYLLDLAAVFYKNGHGAFLTKEIKNEIFHIRTNVYKLVDIEERRGKTGGEVLIENAGLIEFFRESYKNLRGTIKTYLREELMHEVED